MMLPSDYKIIEIAAAELKPLVYSFLKVSCMLLIFCNTIYDLSYKIKNIPPYLCNCLAGLYIRIQQIGTAELLFTYR